MIDALGIRLPLFLLALLVFGLAGCGGGATQGKQFPVEGQIRWENGLDAGQLDGGAVEFEKDGTVVAKASVISDATFTLAEPLPPSTYRLRVLPPESAKGLVPARYQSFEKSGFSVEVTSGPKHVILVITR